MTLTTHRTAAQVEWKQMSDETLMWRFEPGEKVAVGDDVTVKTSDGHTFAGEIVEVENGRLRVSFS